MQLSAPAPPTSEPLSPFFSATAQPLALFFSATSLACAFFFSATVEPLAVDDGAMAVAISTNRPYR